MKKIYFILLIMALGNIAKAQKLSLEDCTARAKKQNSAVRLAQMEKEITDKKINEVKSSSLPQVNVNGDYKYLIQIPKQVVPARLAGGPAGEFTTLEFGLPYNLGTSISASQVLYSSQLKNGLALIEIAKEANELGVTKTEKDIAYQVTTLYYNAQIIDKQIAFLQSNIASTKKMTTTMQILKDNQLAKGVDVDRLTLTSQSLETNVENLIANKEQILNSLKILMALPLSDELFLQDLDLSTLSTILTDNNTDYTELKLLEVQKRINTIEQKSINDEFKPTVAAYASYSNTGNANNDNLFWIPTSAVGIQFKWTVFDGFLRKNKVATKQVEARKLDIQQQQINEALNLNLTNAKSNYTIQQRSLGSLQKQIDLASKILEQTQLQLKEGIVSVTDLIQADNSVREAQNNYINAVIKLKLSELEIKKSSGNL